MFDFNPLNAELNPICHLLALLGGATIVVVSRLRVKHCVMKVISKSPSLRLVRLQGQLKLKKKKIYICVFNIFFKIPVYLSSADFSG